jgi:hypothetical protein
MTRIIADKAKKDRRQPALSVSPAQKHNDPGVNHHSNRSSFIADNPDIDAAFTETSPQLHHLFMTQLLGMAIIRA